MTDIDPLGPPRRWFWWPARDLTYRWRPLYRGTEEHCNRTLGIRLPGGVLFLVTTPHMRTRPCADGRMPEVS